MMSRQSQRQQRTMNKREQKNQNKAEVEDDDDDEVVVPVMNRILSKRNIATKKVIEESERTLFFTSSPSNKLKIINDDGSTTASSTHAGLYSCTVEDYGDVNNDDDYEDDGGHCINPRLVANGRQHHADGSYHQSLPLMNLKFYLSSSNNNDHHNNDDNNDDSYLYGRSYDETNNKEAKNNSWEILRAKLPESYIRDTKTTTTTSNNNVLAFESYFQTHGMFDWNDCNFDCCPPNDERGGMEHGKDSPYGHAYTRTCPKSFTVDDQTGEIFIVWEGFYKNCSTEDFFANSQKGLLWTIGISRLKMEDPTCFDTTTTTMENSFARCTVPVSIVYQSTRGRETIVPYGGFGLIPASLQQEQPIDGNDENDHNLNDPNNVNDIVPPRRSFLLSVLHSPGTDRTELQSQLWAYPEGGRHDHADYWKRQELDSASVDTILMDIDVFDGGTIRLHYNKQTGRPDHMCRTIFNEGITCMPISVKEDVASVYVEAEGDPEIFLTNVQVKAFCTLGIASKTSDARYARKTTVVTGLDVIWNEEDGTPDRIFFGCYGQEGGNGNFGSVDRNGDNLIRMLAGAYPGAVIFLPQGLKSMMLQGPSSAGGRGGIITVSNIVISTQSFIVVIIGLFVCIVSYMFVKTRRSHPSRQFSPTSSSSWISVVLGRDSKDVANNTSSENIKRSPAPYFELPVIDSSNNCTLNSAP